VTMVIIGKTQCIICRINIMEGDEFVALPPFLSNRRHPLYKFNDSAFHLKCLSRDPLADQALILSEEIREQGGPGHRLCVVCKEEILDPDDYFGVGFLTSERIGPLFEFNHLHFHKTHFNDWERSNEFRHKVLEFLASVDWEGPIVRFDPYPEWVMSAQMAETE
jgi:hypothetical protein